MEQAMGRIFVVEDEWLLQIFMEGILVDAGFAVSQAFDGDQGIETLDADAARFCCLIADVNLGTKTNGWDVARHARELIPDLPVIYTTSLNAHDWSAMEVPNSLLLTKPYTPVQVVTAITQLLSA